MAAQTNYELNHGSKNHQPNFGQMAPRNWYKGGNQQGGASVAPQQMQMQRQQMAQQPMMQPMQQGRQMLVVAQGGPGSQMMVQTPNGQQMMVQVPMGVVPGAQFFVAY